MDARISISQARAQARMEERERALLRDQREWHAQSLRFSAAAIVIACWFVVPLVALPAMYYMGGSVLAPLCLGGGMLFVGFVSYRLLSWMLMESIELELEHLSAPAVESFYPAPLTERRAEQPEQVAAALERMRVEAYEQVDLD